MPRGLLLAFLPGLWYDSAILIKKGEDTNYEKE